MFMQFRQVFQEQSARGWQIDRDDAGFYLSKFDDNLNDDQFRFYLLQKQDGAVEILHGIRRKSSGRTKGLKKDHPSFHQAARLVTTYNRHG